MSLRGNCVCTVDGCVASVKARGLCARHYQRDYRERHGCDAGHFSRYDEAVIDMQMWGVPQDLSRPERVECVRRYLVRGLSVREIADRLGCSARTVERDRAMGRHPDGRARRTA